MRTAVAGDEWERGGPVEPIGELFGRLRRTHVFTPRQSGRTAAAEAVAAMLATQGVTLTEWQSYLLDGLYGHHSGPQGPIVAIAGPAYPAGANVPNVVIAEIMD